MKNLFKTFNLCLASLAMVFMYSCQQDDVAVVEKSGVEFILSGDRVDNANSANRDDHGAQVVANCDMTVASHAVIEMSGNSYTIDLKQWGDNFKTELIELDPGTYEITSCQLFDVDDNAMYATPMAGSEFSGFVNQAMPFEITVEEYRKTEYDVEVLCVENFTPPQFGFVYWAANMKEVKNLCVFANYCEPEEGHQVATLEAFIYPSSEQTDRETDLIWTGFADGDYESETEDNELLCLKFPYDASRAAADQSYYVELYVNDVLYYGTISLDRVEMINEEDGYLHLNENCEGDFDFLSTTYNITWEDINDELSAGEDGLYDNDLDYNDFVLSTTVGTDISTGDLVFNFMPEARGGAYEHAFKMYLPGTGYSVSGDADNVTTEGGNTVITVYDQTTNAFSPNASFINVFCGETSGTGMEKTIRIENVSEEFTYYLRHTFTANLQVAAEEVYDLFLGELFPLSTFDKDGETFNSGLITADGWEWPQENVDIRTIYGDDYESDFTPDSNTDDLYVNCGAGS